MNYPGEGRYRSELSIVSYFSKLQFSKSKYFLTTFLKE